MNLFKRLPVGVINALLIFSIVIIFLIITTVSYRSVFRIVDNNFWERHTYEVTLNIDNLFIDLLNADTGQRGYIITGKENFLDPYNLAIQNMDKNFQIVKELTKDNPIQQKHLLEMRPLIDKKLVIMKENITLRDTKGFNAASKNVLLETGKKTMDSIRLIMTAMKGEEAGLLKTRIDDSTRATDMTKSILFWGAIIGFLFYLLVNYIIEKYIIEGLVKKPIFAKEKQLLENIGDGVLAIDRSFKITLFNRAATILTGWKAEEAIGKPFRDIVRFIKTDTRKDNIVFIEEAMLYGETKMMESPTSLIQKGGKEISVGDSASPVFDLTGQVDGCIIVFRDMSKEIELEKIRDDFTSRIVHDLRSPLTVINSILADEDTVKKFKSNSKMKEWYAILNTATKQMLEMVNDLLTKSKSQKIGSTVKKVAITDIIKDIVMTLKPVASDKGVTCEYIPPTALPMVSVPDTEHVKEIFTNLFNNAIKYNKSGGSITITHQVVDQFLRTDITDQGVGISSKNLKKVSTPYSRFNEKEGVSGSGLGLYIVKNLVEEVSGRLEIISKEGKGSTFSVYLPI